MGRGIEPDLLFLSPKTRLSEDIARIRDVADGTARFAQGSCCCWSQGLSNLLVKDRRQVCESELSQSWRYKMERVFYEERGE